MSCVPLWAKRLLRLPGGACPPATLIDVGVAYGTPELYGTFPNAALMLVEPLAEWEPVLQRLAEERGADYVLAAAGSEDGILTLEIPGVLTWATSHADGGVPAAKTASDEGRVGIVRREVPVTTLDHLAADRALRPHSFSRSTLRAPRRRS